LIRAVRNGQIYELIPDTKFSKDFPNAFITNHAHWINLSTQEIEFRPLSSIWDSSDSNWRLEFSTTNDSFMRRADSSLVDIHSLTFSTISGIVSPLEQSQYMTVEYTGCLLSVELPRLKLSFFVNEDRKLECRNYRGLVVDDNQCMGTMFGLRSKLVFCPKDPHDKDPRRMVIIPFGRVEFHSEGRHVTVKVVPDSKGRIVYQTYRIDADLGYLGDITSIKGTFFKALLHAVTAFCLPDPLTGRTGTEEALSELNSARSFSFQRLGDSEIEILREIGHLTPQRVFYPRHLRQMQTVTWSCLPPTSQHSKFLSIANDILQHADHLKMFGSCESVDTGELSRGDISLLERSAMRNAVIYPKESSKANGLDLEYQCRHVPSWTSREAVVAGISDTLKRPGKHPTLKTSRSLIDILTEWDGIEGPASDLTSIPSISWLRPNFPKRWLSLYTLCCSYPNNPYSIIFTLSVIAYTTSDSQFPVDTLVAFAKFSQFHSLQPPRISSYCLSEGFEPNRQSLRRIIQGCVLPFAPGNSGSNLDFQSLVLQEKEFERCVQFQVETVINHLIAQWPCNQPSLPVSLSTPLLNLGDVRKDLERTFRSWHKNLQLWRFINEVQRILDKIYSPHADIALAKYTFQRCLRISLPMSVDIDIRFLLNRPAPTIGVPPAILRESVFFFSFLFSSFLLSSGRLT
jgi:hypothetical protein